MNTSYNLTYYRYLRVNIYIICTSTIQSTRDEHQTYMDSRKTSICRSSGRVHPSTHNYSTRMVCGLNNTPQRKLYRYPSYVPQSLSWTQQVVCWMESSSSNCSVSVDFSLDQSLRWSPCGTQSSSPSPSSRTPPWSFDRNWIYMGLF